jgi:hypothetical protein
MLEDFSNILSVTTTRSPLPECFDVWIVENFSITGHEFYMAAVSNCNDHAIGWIFVQIAG